MCKIIEDMLKEVKYETLYHLIQDGLISSEISYEQVEDKEKFRYYLETGLFDRFEK